MKPTEQETPQGPDRVQLINQRLAELEKKRDVARAEREVANWLYNVITHELWQEMGGTNPFMPDGATIDQVKHVVRRVIEAETYAKAIGIVTRRATEKIQNSGIAEAQAMEELAALTAEVSRDK